MKMRTIRRMPPFFNTRREIIRRTRYLSNDKLEIILRTIHELDTESITEEDLKAIEEGGKAIADKNTISLEQFCADAKL